MNARDRTEAPAATFSRAERKRRAGDVAARAGAVDWIRVAQDLDAGGSAVIERLLTRAECKTLAALYPVAGLFRSRVVMARHGFGRGEYRYFNYPLPTDVALLRAALRIRVSMSAVRSC